MAPELSGEPTDSTSLARHGTARRPAARVTVRRNAGALAATPPPSANGNFMTPSDERGATIKRKQARLGLRNIKKHVWSIAVPLCLISASFAAPDRTDASVRSPPCAVHRTVVQNQTSRAASGAVDPRLRLIRGPLIES